MDNKNVLPDLWDDIKGPVGLGIGVVTYRNIDLRLKQWVI